MKSRRSAKSSSAAEQAPATLTRRAFIKGAGAAAAVLTSLGAAASDAVAEPLSVNIAERLGPRAATFELNINGRAVEVTVEPRVTLLGVLRDQLGLTGAKLACDRGACGACTIHFDGRPIVSCMVLAVSARGHRITTIEGLGDPARMHPVQSAFVANDALQCGFCTPGMVMSVAALFERDPRAGLDEIKHAVAGNICRCGTYPHVFRAALQVAGHKQEASPAQNGGVPSKRDA